MAAKKNGQKSTPPAKGKPAPPAAAPSSAKSGKNAGREIAAEKQKDNERVICENRKARFQYFTLDTLETGIVLTGSEVKSLRQGNVSIEESYARIKGGEVWLINSNIDEYVWANRWNHLPKRPRKLLLHRREIAKFAGKADDKGLTLVPLKIYFKEGRAKVLLGVCRGKHLHDKRQTMKKNDAKRDMQRALRGRG